MGGMMEGLGPAHQGTGAMLCNIGCLIASRDHIMVGLLCGI